MLNLLLLLISLVTLDVKVAEQNPLAKKLLYVPHYKLCELDLDQTKINQEISALENWQGYNNDVKGIRGAGVSNY